MQRFLPILMLIGLVGCGQGPLVESRHLSLYADPGFAQKMRAQSRSDIPSRYKYATRLVQNDWVGTQNGTEASDDTRINFYDPKYNSDPQDFRTSFLLKLPNQNLVAGEIGSMRTAQGYYKGAIQTADYYHYDKCCLPIPQVGQYQFSSRRCYDVTRSDLEGKQFVMKDLVDDKNRPILKLNFLDEMGKEFDPPYIFRPAADLK